MLKKMMITTAVSALMMGSALAANETDKPGAAPAASSTEMKSPAAPTTSTEMKTPAAPSTSASSTPVAKTEAKFVYSQRQDQFLASKFKGTDVIGADDKKIGDVSDILFDKDGKIEAYVVGVGGFLGIGSKDVALAPTAFQVVPGDKSKNESDKLRLSMTKDQLKEAANFEPYKAPRATTGMGGGSTRPMGGPTAPAPAAK
jgi:sporulation protein YlmC with PRC-barrel domain